MAKCDTCGTAILFAGIREGELRFCKEDCHEVGRVRLERPMPRVMVTGLARRWFDGPCPNCEGKGPVDAHFTHAVLSAVLIRFSTRRPLVSCRACARKRQVLATLVTLLFGWWSLSGLLMTPRYIFRNIRALLAPDRQSPSPALLDLAYWDLVQRQVEPVVYRPADETGPLEVY